MLAAIRAIDKALFVDCQKNAGMRDVFVAVADGLGGFDLKRFDGLAHGNTGKREGFSYSIAYFGGGNSLKFARCAHNMSLSVRPFPVKSP